MSPPPSYDAYLETLRQLSAAALTEVVGWNPADELDETWLLHPDYLPEPEEPDQGAEWPYSSF